MAQVALVSGASKGIGRAIALRLADGGYDVFLLGRDETTLAAVTAECTARSVQAEFLAGDLREAGFITAAYATARALWRHRRVD